MVLFNSQRSFYQKYNTAFPHVCPINLSPISSCRYHGWILSNLTRGFALHHNSSQPWRLQCCWVVGSGVTTILSLTDNRIITATGRTNFTLKTSLCLPQTLPATNYTCCEIILYHHPILKTRLWHYEIHCLLFAGWNTLKAQTRIIASLFVAHVHFNLIAQASNKNIYLTPSCQTDSRGLSRAAVYQQ